MGVNTLGRGRVCIENPTKFSWPKNTFGVSAAFSAKTRSCPAWQLVVDHTCASGGCCGRWRASTVNLEAAHFSHRCSDPRICHGPRGYTVTV